MRSFLYRVLSASNDVRAASRGPAPLAKRLVRKTAMRAAFRLISRATR